MKYDRIMRYTNYEDYFHLDGDSCMLFTAQAAIQLCTHAAEKNVIIWRVEGGIWHNPGFELRHDCIWDGSDNQMTLEEAHQNNLQALAFIEEEKEEHDTFVFTTRTLDRVVQPPTVHPWPR